MLTPLAIASSWVLSNVEDSTAGNADIVVEIQQGWTPAQVGDTLAAAGRDRVVDRVPGGRRQRQVHHVRRRAATTSSRTARPARPSTRCAADRGASSPTSSCCSRPGSRCSRSPTASASSRARARSASWRRRSQQPGPVALPAQRRDVARGPHLARHLLHRRQRDRGADPAEDRRTSSTPRPTRSGSARRAPPTAGSRRTRRW